MRYRQKTEIDAFQWDGKPDGTRPDWLETAMNKQPGETGAFYRTEIGQWLLMSPAGAMFVHPGDFIMRFSDGRLAATDPTSFHELYVPIPE